MFGFLITPRTPRRGAGIVEAALSSAASRGYKACRLSKYRPCSTLVLYGVGGADRQQVAQQHLAAGGRLIHFDAGYWDRKLPQHKRRYRVSVDDYHPWRYVMVGADPKPRARVVAAPARQVDGPIMLVGHAPKSIRAFAEGWSAARARDIREAFPGRALIYRPKPNRPLEQGVDCDAISEGPIDEALQACALVVCRHSNVAVDACRLGVPVVCEDGAARAIYPAALADHECQPDMETRQRFLDRLAYWQWSQEEIARGQFWNWYESVQQTFQARGH